MRRISLLVLTLGAFGCTQAQTITPPSAFDRPESISFYCWDRSAAAATDIARCDPSMGGNVDNGTPPDGLELHAVVTQTTTGEVAAVQLTGDNDNPTGAIDSDVRVPGFTFATVGEVPSAVVTPRTGRFTYVISQGSGTLHVIDTASFSGGLGAAVTEVTAADGAPFFPAGSRPRNMALTPSEDALVITVPVLGEIWIVPIDGAVVGAPERITLAADVPDAVDLSALEPEELPPSYSLTCGFEPLEVTPIPPREPVAVGSTPQPAGLVVDEVENRIIVSDEALPLLHVIDLATRTETATFNVGVPTRKIAVTPPVPARLGDVTPSERFLYAIDETDGSVLAVDYGDPARGSYGAVLTVRPTGVRDRLEVPIRAQALAIATPSYDPDAIALCTSPTDVRADRLRGVFLVVGTSDGRLRIFDVFDLDTPCRGNQCPEGEGAGSAPNADALVAIGRHRPRVVGDRGSFIDADEQIEVSDGPSWQSGAAASTVGQSGEASTSFPALEGVTCPESQAPVFPDSGATLVCAVTDPWAATSEVYSFAWEGALPFTASTGGNFVEGTDAIDVRFEPCELGVLGRDDVPESGELSEYEGDVVAITGALPPSLPEELRAGCEALVQQTQTGETTPVLLPLIEARATSERDTYRGRLVVGAPLNVGATLADVRACFPELLQLEVRVRDGYTAISTRAGLRNPVVTSVDGACEVDPTRLAAGQRGRAFAGQPFVTPDITIQLGGLRTAERPVLELTIGNVPTPLSLDAGFDSTTGSTPSLIATIEFNEVDERLYVVEQSQRGLIRLDLSSPESPIEAVFR